MRRSAIHSSQMHYHEYEPAPTTITSNCSLAILPATQIRCKLRGHGERTHWAQPFTFIDSGQYVSPHSRGARLDCGRAGNSSARGYPFPSMWPHCRLREILFVGPVVRPMCGRLRREIFIKEASPIGELSAKSLADDRRQQYHTPAFGAFFALIRDQGG